jgi:hypothetical protein
MAPSSAGLTFAVSGPKAVLSDWRSGDDSVRLDHFRVAIIRTLCAWASLGWPKYAREDTLTRETKCGTRGEPTGCREE